MMVALTRAGRESLPVRNLALSLVAHLEQKDYLGEVRAIHGYVRDHIRYVRDIRGVETLHTAEQILRQAQGDCDDKSVLAASLAEALGHKTRFVVVASHVFPEVNIRGKWIAMECTEPVGLGWAAPAPRRMVENV